MPTAAVRPPLEDVESIRMFLQEERIMPGAHLLDVPCGIGRRAVGLAESGFEVTAVDPNEIGIAAAKERIAGPIADRLHLASASRPPRATRCPDCPRVPGSTQSSAWTMHWGGGPRQTMSHSSAA